MIFQKNKKHDEIVETIAGCKMAVKKATEACKMFGCEELISLTESGINDAGAYLVMG